MWIHPPLKIVPYKFSIFSLNICVKVKNYIFVRYIKSVTYALCVFLCLNYSSITLKVSCFISIHHLKKDYVRLLEKEMGEEETKKQNERERGREREREEKNNIF